MNLSTVKLIRDFPASLHKIKCPQRFNDMGDYVEVMLDIKPTIAGYMFVNKDTNKIYAVHLYKNTPVNSYHSRSVDTMQGLAFKNEGNFPCFDPNDQFQTTVEKYLSFLETITNSNL